jgi:hypothetical protein
MWYSEPLYALVTPSQGPGTAVCQEVIERLPEIERGSQPSAQDRDGINVHEGSASENFNGAYAWSGFTIGKFLFSVSPAVAEQHFPQYMSGIR